MKIFYNNNMYHLLLIALFLCVSTFSVVKSQEVKVEVEGGTCDPGDSTCVADDVTTSASASASASSTQQQSKDDVCFPDGKCFSSIEEAEINYKNKHDEKQSFNMDIRKPTKFGNAQEIALDSNQQQSYITKTLEVLSKSHDYMIEIFKDDTTVSFRKECKLRNDLCAFWAAIGECEVNPKYMLLECAPACQTCHQLSFEHRCPYDRDAPKVWGPGDLNKMFERLTTDEYYIKRFEPTIHSQPPDGPWLITLENVATEEECKRMIQLGADRGYERSQDVGAKKFDGTFDSTTGKDRTSHNTWCLDECYKNEIHQNVLRNVENITGIPDENSEYWQLLQYEESQFYADHHDYIPFHNNRFQGARIMTVFLYLNDVEEGGGTYFNDLDITIQPKTGRAVVWPSVKDDFPDRKDPRTSHEALPVKRGIKYGANAWIHQRSFKKVFEENCS